MHITGLYAALCALIALVLAARISMYRNKAQVGLGSGGDMVLQQRIRAFGNFVEYVPLALLLLLVLELDHTQIWLLHVFGIVLVVSRVGHGVGLSSSAGKSYGRMFGTLGTWLVLLVMALLLLWKQLAMWMV